MESFQISLAKDTERDEIVSFLKEYYETSLFLLQNLEEHGFTMGEAPRSGNWKVIRDSSGKLRAVFYLLKRGTILVQTDRQRDYTDLIFNACLEEELPISGVVGEWTISEPLFERARQLSPERALGFNAKEALYSRELTEKDIADITTGARLLVDEEFSEYDLLSSAYCDEVGVPYDKNLKAREVQFLSKVSSKQVWGKFLGDRLVSIGEYNAFVPPLAQLGGIFTLVEHRKQGHAKEMMLRIVQDSIEVHNLQKLILFTDTARGPAPLLYEGVGFKEIGEFALLFLE